MSTKNKFAFEKGYFLRQEADKNQAKKKILAKMKRDHESLKRENPELAQELIELTEKDKK